MTRIPTSAQPAIIAFLRGVDRRGRLLALVQTGDSGTAQTALAVAARVFASEAGQWPIAQWPMQYWRLLLSAPAMGQRRSDGDRSDVLPEIARLTPPLRAAVLLHLVAGLEDADAAAALGLGVDVYHQRIRDALPCAADGAPDLAVWRGWRDAAQQTLETLPDAGEVVPSLPTPAHTPKAAPRPDVRIWRERDAATMPPPRQRARWYWWLLCAALLVALVAAWALLHPRGRALVDVWRGHIHAESLPPAAAPKARFDPADAALDPDRAMHADPAELALARRLPLLAWLVASGASPATQAPENTAPATPPPQANHASTTAIDERSSDRMAWFEWQALTGPERSALRAAAVRFDGLSAQQQDDLRARYTAQPFDARRGWHLGPTLGPAWPRVAPLFAFSEDAERSALLALLRQATPDEIDILARLAQTTPPQARAQFRRELLAQPADHRESWLQVQLNR